MKKPKSKIVKDIFSWLATAGAIYIAASSPYFVHNLIRSHKRWEKYPKGKLADTFYNLRRRGLIEIENQGPQVYIRLTKEGKKKAGMFQINDLEIKKPEKWDGKWRLVIFDIAQLKKFYREVFRGKLKELGFIPLQKSIWAHPFDCKMEIKVLRDFLGLSEKEIRLIVADDIGDDTNLKKTFGLK